MSHRRPSAAPDRITECVREVIEMHQTAFAASSDGIHARAAMPAHYRLRMCDPDAIVALAKQQSRHHVLRRMNNKALKKIVVAVLASAESSNGILVDLDNNLKDSDNEELASDTSDSIAADDANINLIAVKDTNTLNRHASSSAEISSKVPNPDESEIVPEKEPTTEATPKEVAEERINKMRLANGSSKRRKTNQDASDSNPKGNAQDKYAPPKTKLSDLAGIESCIEDVLQLIGMPLESQVPFIQISAPSIVSGMSGESEKKIREIFEEARQHAPCILFIDEIDAITPKRETAQREMERRIVAQLLTCMDDISLDKTDGKSILVIGATNRPDSLDPALRRAGRFDREISMGVPDENSRRKILEKLCANLRLEGSFDFGLLAKQTPGYVGADLNALTSEAGMVAVRRIFKTISRPFEDPMEVEQSNTSIITDFLSKQNGEKLSDEALQDLSIIYADFVEALTKVQPSSKREGFTTVPDITWEDVGALGNIRDELRMSVVEPIKYPELFSRVGITKPMGVLLYGPPGCGKTMLAKAVASESCCNFISVKGPELLNKFVGESERGNQSASRLVNTLLTELDGMNTRSQVYIIAATNRPDMIDPAMLRPGRLDKTLYVDLPSASERFQILKTITRKTPLHPSVDLSVVARDQRCDGFSGADLAALVREAGVAALRGSIYAKQVLMGSASGSASAPAVPSDDTATLWVTAEHFGVAFGKMTASVSKKDRKRYELLKVKFSGSSAVVTDGET
ncbi:hypothetical protein HDU84_006510 [Entophlyctis sp. JEL0112]|nr:hypothetical protein HDU84_006510 [Entophlyctis sp. JEL0112]